MEKSALEAVHKEELEKLKEVTTAEALEEGKKQSNESLLVLSKFLRAAAAKRQNGDEHSAENRAFEGALLLVYGGEIGAVEAMEKLISGSDEKVSTTDGKLSELSCELDFFWNPGISKWLLMDHSQGSQGSLVCIHSSNICRRSLGRRRRSGRAGDRARARTPTYVN